MKYTEFLKYNELNINNNVNKFRISKIFNDRKTCTLHSATYKNANPSVIDIVHIVAEVRAGRMALTNPSKIRNWKYFSKD